MRFNNFIQNIGSTVAWRTGLDADRTAIEFEGLYYTSTDTQEIHYYDGTAWILIASTGGGSLPALAQYHTYVGDATNQPVDAGNIVFLDNSIYEVDLGDFTGAQNNTYFLIRDDLKKMWAHVGGAGNAGNFGYEIDCSGNFIARFGAWAGSLNKTAYVLNDTTRVLYTTSADGAGNLLEAGFNIIVNSLIYEFGGYGTGSYRMSLYINEGQKRIKLGQQDALNDDTFLEIFNDNSALIRTHSKSIEFGIEVDGADRKTTIGDYDQLASGYRFGVDDLNGVLFADGMNLISGTASGSSGDHLVITINGNVYKIALLNP